MSKVNYEAIGKLILVFLLFGGAQILTAAPMGPPIGPPGPPPCWPPPCIPVDGGLSFLLVAGAAYGGKKLYDFNKKKNHNKAE
jgi:hypothetical protein